MFGVLFQSRIRCVSGALSNLTLWKIWCHAWRSSQIQAALWCRALLKLFMFWTGIIIGIKKKKLWILTEQARCISCGPNLSWILNQAFVQANWIKQQHFSIRKVLAMHSTSLPVRWAILASTGNCTICTQHLLLCGCRNPTNPELPVPSWGNLLWPHCHKPLSPPPPPPPLYKLHQLHAAIPKPEQCHYIQWRDGLCHLLCTRVPLPHVPIFIMPYLLALLFFICIYTKTALLCSSRLMRSASCSEPV